jgi:ribonuclease BN (tRNA processing enzyme)
VKLEILGCYGNVTERCRTSAFLVNDRVLLDAGTVTEVLSPERLEAISHVFLSHIHLDHVKGLCSLAEELSMHEDRGVTVLADKSVLTALSRHVLNDVLWPDFSAIPDRINPVIRLQAVEPFEHTTVESLRIQVIPVGHKVRTFGFLVKEGNRSIMLTSDTGMTAQFWETAKREDHVEFVIADVAFPNRLTTLASISGHMTLSVLLDRIDAYALHDTPFYIAYMKSMFEEEIRRDISKAGRQNLRILEQGSVLFA